MLWNQCIGAPCWLKHVVVMNHFARPTFLLTWRPGLQTPASRKSFSFKVRIQLGYGTSAPFRTVKHSQQDQP